MSYSMEYDASGLTDYNSTMSTIDYVYPDTVIHTVTSNLRRYMFKVQFT